jgi:hypothetical protein
MADDDALTTDPAEDWSAAELAEIEPPNDQDEPARVQVAPVEAPPVQPPEWSPPAFKPTFAGRTVVLQLDSSCDRPWQAFKDAAAADHDATQQRLDERCRRELLATAEFGAYQSGGAKVAEQEAVLAVRKQALDAILAKLDGASELPELDALERSKIEAQALVSAGERAVRKAKAVLADSVRRLHAAERPIVQRLQAEADREHQTLLAKDREEKERARSLFSEAVTLFLTASLRPKEPIRVRGAASGVAPLPVVATTAAGRAPDIVFSEYVAPDYERG